LLNEENIAVNNPMLRRTVHPIDWAKVPFQMGPNTSENVGPSALEAKQALPLPFGHSKKIGVANSTCIPFWNAF
jgi:hypothetical protein